jgi:hypothetical protein
LSPASAVFSTARKPNRMSETETKPSFWLRVKNWFRHSETIAWARAQAALGLGLLAFAFTNTDLTQYLTGKWLIVYLLANAAITELLRRKNTTTVTETAPSGETVLTLERTENVTKSGAAVPQSGGDAGTTASEMKPPAGVNG